MFVKGILKICVRQNEGMLEKDVEVCVREMIKICTEEKSQIFARVSRYSYIALRARQVLTPKSLFITPAVMEPSLSYIRLPKLSQLH